jgi:hypothetical protein
MHVADEDDGSTPQGTGARVTRVAGEGHWDRA